MKITVNMLFNSIQFNSIPKIVSLINSHFKIFLIALLSFILLFSISCESNEKPPEPPKPYTPKHELEGTWVGYDKKDTKYENYELKFTVDSDGNITFSPRPYPHVIKLGVTNLSNYTYTGKIETNAIIYPYTNDVNCDYVIKETQYTGDGYGKFIFSNSSTCTARYDRIDSGNDAFEFEEGKTNSKYLGLRWVSVEFTKQ